MHNKNEASTFVPAFKREWLIRYCSKVIRKGDEVSLAKQNVQPPETVEKLFSKISSEIFASFKIVLTFAPAIERKR